MNFVYHQSDYVIATYRFPKGVDAEKQAKTIAIGQTAGSWDARFQHMSEAFEKHMGKVAEISQDHGTFLAKIAFPLIDFERDIAGFYYSVWQIFNGNPCKAYGY